MSIVFDVLSLNTVGIGDSIERRKVFNYAKKHTSSAGIIFLQKTVLKKRKVMGISVELWRKAVIFSHRSSNAM